MRFRVWVPGRPIPKPQRFTRKSHPQWAWRDAIGWEVKKHREDTWPLVVPVQLGMVFCVLRTGRRPPDFKNLWACVEDGLTGVLYADDWQVSGVICPSERRVVDDLHGQGLSLTVEY